MNSAANSTSTVKPFERLADEYLAAYVADDDDKSMKQFAAKYDLDKRFVLASLLKAVRDGEVLILDTPVTQDRRQLN